MRHLVRRITVAAALIIPMIVGPAAAAQASPGGAAGPLASGPTVNIFPVAPGAPRFNPSQQIARLHTGSCTATNNSFRLRNKTHVTQQLIIAGSATTIGSPIPPAGIENFCSSVAGTTHFSLNGHPLAKLMIVVP